MIDLQIYVRKKYPKTFEEHTPVIMIIIAVNVDP